MALIADLSIAHFLNREGQNAATYAVLKKGEQGIEALKIIGEKNPDIFKEKNREGHTL